MATHNVIFNADTQQQNIDLFPREIRHNQDLDPFHTLDNMYNITQKLENSRISTYNPKIKQYGMDGKKIPVNATCLCGSGKKFKKCCINNDSINGLINTRCNFCYQMIHTICFEDYLNHVEDDRIELIRSFDQLKTNGYNEKRKEWESNLKVIKSAEDLNFTYEPSPELQREINKRINKINELEKFLSDQRKKYPIYDI